MVIEGKVTNWEDGPIGPGFLMMFAPLAGRVLDQRVRRKKKPPKPLTRKEEKLLFHEEEVLALLLLVHAQ